MFSRRSFLMAIQGLPFSVSSNSASSETVEQQRSIEDDDLSFKRIAVEEAFATSDLFAEWKNILLTEASKEPGFQHLYKPFLESPETQTIRNRLMDVGEGRIREMKKYGIDMQILSITAPGVQVFSEEKAVSLAYESNDYLAHVIRKNPKRYAGLAAIAPQSPYRASLELKRAVESLGMKGAIINSHTRGEYLDNRKYWPLFEAAEALDVPIYLHPRTPSPQMLQPFLTYGLDGAGWGFSVETSLHAMKLVLSGLFDQFPKLKIVLGHMGEGVLFWLSRIDKHFDAGTWTGKMNEFPQRKLLKKLPSEYFKENFFVTTSGMNWSPALKLALSVLGADKILFAADYPYESMDEAVRGMENSTIDNIEKKKIYQLNAENLFKLD